MFSSDGIQPARISILKPAASRDLIEFDRWAADGALVDAAHDGCVVQDDGQKTGFQRHQCDKKLIDCSRLA